jgi:hypothetical protein
MLGSPRRARRDKAMLAPEVNAADATRVATFLRRLSDAELSQAIATPRALVGRLEGFTQHHLRTAAETTVLQLARDEQTRRRDAEIGRRARNALFVSVGALTVAILALVLSFCAWRFPVR